MGTVGLCVGGIIQGGGLSEADGNLAEGVVDFEDFSAVDALRVLGWAGASLWNIAIALSL